MPSSDHTLRTEVCVSSRDEWRAWLKKHHNSEKEVWLVYYKKHTGKPSISYVDSVEEALCFGWIDGMKRSLDEERYTHRFSPRRPKSKWTPLNIKRARSMVDAGRMTKAGFESFNQRLDYDDGFLEEKARKTLVLTPQMETVLKENKNAWINFNNLAPGYKRQYIAWLTTAKRPDTRKCRLEEAIRLLSENRKLGMK